MPIRTLIDTNNTFDAGLLGLDGPRDPRTSSEGLIVEFHTDDDTLTIITPDSSIDITGAKTIYELSESLRQVSRLMKVTGKLP
jgi:hypothetical protein